MSNDKTYKLEVTKRDLEVLIRGCRHMAKDYKRCFANAYEQEDEQKFLRRFYTADKLIADIGTILDQIEYDADAELEAEQNEENVIISAEPEKKWKVSFVTTGGAKIPFAEYATEKEAIEFCAFNNWFYKDENDFVWNLVIEEDD